MALLDVSEVIRCPLFTSEITVFHRGQSFDENGNPVWEEESSRVVEAVVTSDAKTLERMPDALRRAGSILVRFMIEDAPDGFQGGGYDGVIWRGKRFVVKDCADYAQFGEGFYRLLCWPEDADDGSYKNSSSSGFDSAGCFA